MKHEQRKPWIEAARDRWLCGACNYIEWFEDEYDCSHPIDRVADESCWIEPGTDCWGFRLQKGLTLETLRKAVKHGSD